MKVDDVSSFVEKVASMREAQKEHKVRRDLGTLGKCELAEAEVDRAISVMRRKVDKEAKELTLGLF